MQGYDAFIINYLPNAPKNAPKTKIVPDKFNFPALKQLYLIRYYIKRHYTQKRFRVFLRFYNKYIAPIRGNIYINIDALRSDPPQADTYIAGSDQIWNTAFKNGKDPAFYLDFGSPETKRISYAASFATESIATGYEDFVKKELGNFDAISVREASGIKILKSLGYNGTVVADPVFLVDKSFWDKMDGSVEIPSNPYLVVYDFENSAELKAVAKRIARLKGYKIVSVSPITLSYANYNYRFKGPDAFVSLIRHAECVVSNSFHGSAFALIFKKDFFVVNRADGLNKRMSDLLEHYGISDRLVSAQSPDSALSASIDYGKVSPLVNDDAEYSRKWLLDNV